MSLILLKSFPTPANVSENHAQNICKGHRCDCYSPNDSLEKPWNEHKFCSREIVCFTRSWPEEPEPDVTQIIPALFLDSIIIYNIEFHTPFKRNSNNSHQNKSSLYVFLVSNIILFFYDKYTTPSCFYY